MNDDVERAIAAAISPSRVKPEEKRAPATDPMASRKKKRISSASGDSIEELSTPVAKREKSRMPRSEGREPENYDTESLQERRQKSKDPDQESLREKKSGKTHREKAKTEQKDMSNAVYKTSNSGGPVDLFAVGRRSADSHQDHIHKSPADLKKASSSLAHASSSSDSSSVSSSSSSSSESVRSTGSPQTGKP